MIRSVTVPVTLAVALIMAGCAKDPKEVLQSIPDDGRRRILQTLADGSGISAEVTTEALKEGVPKRIETLTDYAPLLSIVSSKVEEILRNDALWQARLTAFSKNQINGSDGDTGKLYDAILNAKVVKELTNDQPLLLMALVMQETGLLKNLRSNVGAIGLFQFYTITRADIKSGNWRLKYPNNPGINALVRRYEDNLQFIEQSGTWSTEIQDIDARENIALAMAFLQDKQMMLNGDMLQMLSTIMLYNGSATQVKAAQGQNVGVLLATVRQETRLYGPGVLAFHTYIFACETSVVKAARAKVRPESEITNERARALQDARYVSDEAKRREAEQAANEEYDQAMRDNANLPVVLRATIVEQLMEQFTAENLGFRLFQTRDMVQDTKAQQGVIGTMVQGTRTEFEVGKNPTQREKEAQQRLAEDQRRSAEESWWDSAKRWPFGRPSPTPQSQQPSQPYTPQPPPRSAKRAGGTSVPPRPAPTPQPTPYQPPQRYQEPEQQTASPRGTVPPPDRFNDGSVRIYFEGTEAGSRACSMANGNRACKTSTWQGKTVFWYIKRVY